MVMFARVVEANGFSEAARRLGASKSRVSKAIAKLERALGAKLLNRSTRGLSLTEVGAAFHEHCVRIVEEAARAAEVVDQLQTEPRGVLRISAPVALGRLHVAPALAEFVVRYPGVTLDVDITDRLVDLVDEGVDVAIRIAREPSQYLVAHELALVRRVVCATPAYFERFGIPVAPMDLQRHNCLHHTQFGVRGHWRLHGKEGQTIVPISGSLCINDDDTLAQAVRAGAGVALLPTFIIGGDLQSGRLKAVLPDYVPVERRIYAVRLPNRTLPIKVRAFIDFLRERFTPVPPWDR
ncbi:MAG: LysR family transcriptional regulator [Burkholderiaceae bacterium]